MNNWKRYNEFSISEKSLRYENHSIWLNLSRKLEKVTDATPFTSEVSCSYFFPINHICVCERRRATEIKQNKIFLDLKRVSKKKKWYWRGWEWWGSCNINKLNESKENINYKRDHNTRGIVVIQRGHHEFEAIIDLPEPVESF